MAVTLEDFLNVKKTITQNSRERNITSRPGSGLAYLRYRLLRPYYKLKAKQFQKKYPQHPWLTASSIKVFDLLLTKDDVGLEYGSGRSTYHFAKLLGHLTSVEHHEEWYNIVKETLTNNKVSNVNLKLIPPNTAYTKPNLSSVDDYYLDAEAYPIKDDVFLDYVHFIDSIPNDSLDFILIDGRARVSCSKKSVSKLKSGGLFVLDNSERVRYREIHEMLETWPNIYSSTGLTDTIIWRKP